MILVIVYITVVMIISMIIRAWSWKKISCSMIGDALSWRLRFSHVVIFVLMKVKNFIHGA